MKTFLLLFIFFLFAFTVKATCVYDDFVWTSDEIKDIKKVVDNICLTRWHALDMLGDIRKIDYNAAQTITNRMDTLFDDAFIRKIDNNAQTITNRMDTSDDDLNLCMCNYEIWVYLRELYPGDYQTSCPFTCWFIEPLRQIIRIKRAHHSDISPSLDIPSFFDNYHASHRCINPYSL